jgi:site-specific DNA recombinase
LHVTPKRPAKTSSDDVAIDVYSRLSKHNDGTTRTVESQEERGVAWIKATPGVRLGKIFRDNAKSAWKPNVVRKDWNLLMDRLESGVSGGVWVAELTRFTRKPMEGERLIAQADAGVRVISDSNEYDLMDPNDRANFRHDMARAAQESDTISKRTRLHKARKANSGRSNAGVRGYARPGRLPKPKGWMPGDDLPPMASAEQLAGEREIVRDMAERLLGGESLNMLVRDLTERGITTQNGSTWTVTSVRMLLKRPSLCGLVEHYGKVVSEMRGDSEHPLDRETWDAIQRMFAAAPRGRPASRYLLTGLLFCGECGHPMKGRPASVRPTYPDGEVARQYWCATFAHGGGCGRNFVDQRWADSVVEVGVIERLSDPETSKRLEQLAQAAHAHRAPLLATITKLEGQRLAVAAKVAQRGLEWVEQATDAIDAELAKQRASLASIEAVDGPLVPAALVADQWADAQAQGKLDVLREMVREAFPALTVMRSKGRNYWQSHDRFDWQGKALATLAS